MTLGRLGRSGGLEGFLLSSVVLLLFCGGGSCGEGRGSSNTGSFTCADGRPVPKDRKFKSDAIESYLTKALPKFKDAHLAEIFEVTLPNALDTTFYEAGVEDTFVITGDIPAMWLRDATFQVQPYLRFLREDRKLREAICGLVKRQARSILIDPFANAFNFNSSGAGHQTDRRIPAMSAGVFEGKYELDSLVSFLKLSNAYWQKTGDRNCFLSSALWFTAVDKVLQTFELMIEPANEESEIATHQQVQHPPVYFFLRSENDLQNNGTGPPARKTKMIRSAFRPSDDAATFPFNIPANLFALTELKNLNLTLSDIQKNEQQRQHQQERLATTGAATLASKAMKIAHGIEDGIKRYAFRSNPANQSESILAYEVDGYGSTLFMDDANSPSLLSLPYLGAMQSSDVIFRATRRFVLGETNPYYFSGKAGSGVGGPHVGYGFIWPLSIIYSLYSASSDEEILRGLQLLKDSTAGTKCMHESFYKDDVQNFTRSWFAWANSAFADLVLHLIETKPHLILHQAAL